jgi:PhnB protein
MITPYLYYEDVRAALTFLSKAFGFKKFGRPMSGSGGKIQHAAMKLGDAMVMMGYPGPQYKNPKHLGEATQSLYVNVDDVDKHCARARRAGAKIIEEPAETRYGARRYGAEDPEGHQWYFAEDVAKPRKRKRSR